MQLGVGVFKTYGGRFCLSPSRFGHLFRAQSPAAGTKKSTIYLHAAPAGRYFSSNEERPSPYCRIYVKDDGLSKVFIRTTYYGSDINKVNGYCHLSQYSAHAYFAAIEYKSTIGGANILVIFWVDGPK